MHWSFLFGGDWSFSSDSKWLISPDANNENGNYNVDTYYDLYWMKSYYCKMENNTKDMGIRDFNFSLYRAGKYVK